MTKKYQKNIQECFNNVIFPGYEKLLLLASYFGNVSFVVGWATIPQKIFWDV